jgi:hypothetical protein
LYRSELCGSSLRSQLFFELLLQCFE